MAELAIDRPLSTFRCEVCGYGACCRVAPQRCPMCGQSKWSYEPGSRFADDLDAPLGRESLR
jgi:rubrerythrin